jgi:hypothetical protein
MTGTFQDFTVTDGSVGQQYTTIDGVKNLTWFDLMNSNLRGLKVGAQVEFEARPGPAALCDSPRAASGLASARLVRVVKPIAQAV